jgi:hypothetical protein
LNPLHIYCRLAGCGLTKAMARRVSTRYEALYKLVW